MTIILGLDVGRSSAVGFALDFYPINAKQHFKKHRRDIVRLNANAEGVEKILAISPNAIVLEPTGSWYSAFWVRVAQVYNIDIVEVK